MRPGTRSSGRLEVVLILRNTTRTRAPSASAPGDVAALVRALDGARGGVYPAGGVSIPVGTPVDARTALVEAPLAVRGEISFPAGHIEDGVAGGGQLDGDRVRFMELLGDGEPLTRTVRLSRPGRRSRSAEDPRRRHARSCPGGRWPRRRARPGQKPSAAGTSSIPRTLLTVAERRLSAGCPGQPVRPVPRQSRPDGHRHECCRLRLRLGPAAGRTGSRPRRRRRPRHARSRARSGRRPGRRRRSGRRLGAPLTRTRRFAEQQMEAAACCREGSRLPAGSRHAEGAAEADFRRLLPAVRSCARRARPATSRSRR